MPKILNNASYGTKLGIFAFSEMLQSDKFVVANFKYDNSFLKLEDKNTQIRYFWSQIYAIFVFLQNSAFWQI